MISSIPFTVAFISGPFLSSAEQSALKPLTSLHGCIAVKCGEECFACRNASVPHVSTVSSPLPHPWDSGRTIWTPDILGLLCASVTVM